MAIGHLEARLFTVFSKIDLDFSPGINVIIGENSTGKSHLMKLLYAVSQVLFTSEKEGERKLLEAELHKKLVNTFKPDEGKLGRLVQRSRGRATARMNIRFGTGGFSFRYTTLSNLAIEQVGARQEDNPIFIPSREVLAIYPGFVQAYENRELAFDETYRDICVALSGSLTRGPRQEKIQDLVSPLEKRLGGKVVLDNDRFFVKARDGNIEAHLLAEGLRKLASIVFLINNGSLTERSILFWDEPEANLNPTLVKLLCDVLRQLANSGMQIFLASHDYLLTQELALASEYKTEPHVPIRFFAHSRNAEGHVDIEQADDLAELRNNAILEEFAAHYDREAMLFAERAEVQR